jgi:seryl-tRNA synthetase
MTDQELKDLVASLAISKAQTDEQLRETDKQMQETNKEMQELQRVLKKVSQMVGNISNNQGDVAEEFFYNSLTANPTLNGISYDLTYKNVTARQGNTEDEYDVLMINGKDVAIVEIKYKAHTNDVARFVNKKYPNFKKLYPEYSHYNHHLALASFYISDDVKNEALQNNIMVLQRKGDIIETIMP